MLSPTPSPATRRKLARTFGLALVALLAAGCGIGGSGQPNGHSSKSAMPVHVRADKHLAAKIPKNVAANGQLVIANDQTYAPNEFRDNGALVGMDVDLGRAIAARLGLRARFQNSSFDGILGGISAHKYDISLSSFSVSAERLKEVNLVSYYVAGTSLGTLRGNPSALALHNLCGKTIAVQKGTTQLEDMQARNKRCRKQGRPPATVRQFQLQTDVNLALAAERVQGELADSPVLDYSVKQTEHKLATVGDSYANAPYGVAIPKDNPRLADAVRAAIQSLMDDGGYRAILEKWGLERGAIKHAEVNPSVTDYQ